MNKRFHNLSHSIYQIPISLYIALLERRFKYHVALLIYRFKVYLHNTLTAFDISIKEFPLKCNFTKQEPILVII